MDLGERAVQCWCYWYPHRQVLLHHNHLHSPPHPLLLLQPIGDGPAHHPAPHNDDVSPLRGEVGVGLQWSPVAPRQRVLHLLSHRRQLLLQI